MLNLDLLEDKIVHALLKCAETHTWSEIDERTIAAQAGLSLSEVSAVLPTKKAILVAFARRVDSAVLKTIEAQDGFMEEHPRDRLFDVIMTRFELLQSYKSALHNITKDLRKTSHLSDVPFDQIMGSFRWMLAAAGISSSGSKGNLRLLGLTRVYADVFDVWLQDDDAGLAKTMATLDKRLRSGEAWIKRADMFMDEGSALLNRIFKRRSRPSSPENDADNTHTTSEDHADPAPTQDNKPVETTP